jgi:RNA polymerase sigma factor (sigma-70 family)
MIALAEADDTEALGVLLKRYEPELLGIAKDVESSKAAGQVSASDIVQDTYYDIIKNLPVWLRAGDVPSFESEHQFKSWLFIAVKHNLLDRIRRVTTKGRDVDRERPIAGGSANSDDSSLGYTPQDRRQGPATAVAERERTEALKALIRKTLDPRQAAAVECSYLEGLTIPEIQERLGCETYEAAASLLRHGRANLKKKAPEQLELLFPTGYGESKVGSRVQWTGKAKSVSRSSSKITICIKNDNHTFTVPDDVKILVNGQPACLDEIEPDFSVTLTANGDIARTLDAGSSWDGAVASVSDGQISLQLDTERHTFEVAGDSRISRGGKPIALNELDCGEIVTVTVKDGLAQAIEVTQLDLE